MVDQTQSIPPKKRRRWLTVTLVLVLVSTVSWWYWPRGDARFVGKWVVSDASDGRRMSIVTMDLRGNYTELSLSTGPPPTSTSYQVIGDELVVVTRGTIADKLSKAGFWTGLRRLVTGNHEGLFKSRYRFRCDSSEVVALLGQNDRPLLLLRRIPE
jgi:hypothetical protein